MFKIHIGELRNTRTLGFLQDPAVAFECPLHICIVGKSQSITTGKSNVAALSSGNSTFDFLKPTFGFLLVSLWYCPGTGAALWAACEQHVSEEQQVHYPKYSGRGRGISGCYMVWISRCSVRCQLSTWTCPGPHSQYAAYTLNYLRVQWLWRGVEDIININLISN